MKQFFFRNRIVLNYIFIIGLLILVVFLMIYFIVKFIVYKYFDENLKIEIEDYLKEIKVENNVVILMDVEEWEECEYNLVDVNLVFVQFLDVKKKIIEKLFNLKNEVFVFQEDVVYFKIFDIKLLNSIVRQIQVLFYIKLK